MIIWNADIPPTASTFNTLLFMLPLLIRNQFYLLLGLQLELLCWSNKQYVTPCLNTWPWSCIQGVEVGLHTFLKLALYGGQWSDSQSNQSTCYKISMPLLFICHTTFRSPMVLSQIKHSSYNLWLLWENIFII